MKNTLSRHNRNPLKSITYRLPATYAVIAFVVVLVLGLVLYMTLRWYYAAQERAYLEENAEPMSYLLSQMLPTEDAEFLQTQVHFFSFVARTRVEIFDTEGNLLASGDTFDQDPIFSRGNNNSRGFFVRSDSIQGEAGFDYLLISPSNNNSVVIQSAANQIQLLSGENDSASDIASERGSACLRWMEQAITPNGCRLFDMVMTFIFNLFVDSTNITSNSVPYDFSASAAPIDIVPAFDPNHSPIKRAWDRYRQSSSVVYSTPIYDADTGLIGTLRLSDGPAYGGQIIEGVMYGWLLASAVSVGLAIVLGWIASRDVVNPLKNLSIVTQQMAEGDLGARVVINREDEFGMLGTSFNDMANRIEETVSTLRHLLSDAAHEINTPITALRTNLELIHPAEGRETIERALSQVKRLENLTRNLLHLSKLESDIESASIALIDALTLMQTVAQFHASQAEQAGISLNLNLSETTLMIRANEEKMQQALANLLHNAIKFTDANGEICISVQGNDNHVQFTIEDTGIGIPEADLPLLFNRFHRGRNAARYEGSGLGLAIVEMIVKRYGGVITAENTNNGAAFSVIVPRVENG